MEELRLGAVESRFADIIWAHEPLHSRDLVTLCQEQLNWKKPTTYTVLRKLCERGIFQNENGMVSSKISRDEFYAMQSEQFVESAFSGSLPAFLAFRFFDFTHAACGVFRCLYLRPHFLRFLISKAVPVPPTAAIPIPPIANRGTDRCPLFSERFASGCAPPF